MKKEELDEIISNTDKSILDRAENAGGRSQVAVLRIIAAAALFAVLLAAFALPMLNRSSQLTPPDVTDDKNAETAAAKLPIDSSTQEAVTIEELIASYGTFLHYDPVYPVEVLITNSWDEDSWNAYLNARNERRAYYGAGTGLGPFFNSIIKAVKAQNDDSQNFVLSPLNIYMGLALIGEISEGETQKQIFDTLGVGTLAELREKTKKIWLSHYCDDGTYKSLLANSVWMDNAHGTTFNESKIASLQTDYYASVFEGDLHSEDFKNAYRTWLNDQTGGRLKDMTNGLDYNPQTALLIASTVDFAAKWGGLYNVYKTESGYFKTEDVRVPCTFLVHEDMPYQTVYLADSYALYCQEIDNDAGQMWYILPDEGVSVDEVFSKLDFCNITSKAKPTEFGKLTVKVPQFDVSLQSDLRPALCSIGVKACFERSGDFSPIIPNDPAWINQVIHGCAVKTDKEGVVGSAFTHFAISGAAWPQGEKYEFIADRPFIFLIESDDGLPLFAGVVNRP